MDEQKLLIQNNAPILPSGNDNGRFKKILITIGIIFVSFSVGFWLNQGINTIISAYGKFFIEYAPRTLTETDFSRFFDTIGKVEQKYIGDIDYEKLIDGAIAGAIASLNDPFSIYMTEQDLSDFGDELQGNFEGIGMEVSIRDQKLVVVAPVDDSPAKKAGIKPGDIVKLIDDRPTEYMTINEAVDLIRGKAGTNVKLTIIRDNNEKNPLEFKIKRQLINVKSVTYEKKENGIAYVRIMRFDDTVGKLFSSAISQIKKDNAKGMILDLRGNPGGYLDAVVDVASDIIPGKTVVIEEYKDGHKEELKADSGGRLDNISIVVLIDGGSASASEILAGAIRDNERGILIGEKTFGKGSVQEMEQLPDGSAIKITVAKWLTPKGTVIDKDGLNPDIEVKSEESLKDEQLERAMEEVKKIIK